jgi:hypothetical protein
MWIISTTEPSVFWLSLGLTGVQWAPVTSFVTSMAALALTVRRCERNSDGSRGQRGST